MQLKLETKKGKGYLHVYRRNSAQGLTLSECCELFVQLEDYNTHKLHRIIWGAWLYDEVNKTPTCLWLNGDKQTVSADIQQALDEARLAFEQGQLGEEQQEKKQSSPRKRFKNKDWTQNVK